MTLNEYQERASKTAMYPRVAEGLPVYTALGLTEEAGEFAGKVKRALRGEVFNHDGAVKELGDVLWYLAMAARDLGVTLDEVAEVNLAKLAKRAEDGKIRGTGDDR